jgi:hypothetical protein
VAVDVDLYLESLEPPAITLGGKTHKGRLLSLEEWLPFESQFQEIAQQGGDIKLETISKLVIEYCNVAFPITIWQALNPRRRPIGLQILDLPPVAMIKVMRDFFESQARGLDVQRALGVSENPGPLDDPSQPSS